MLYLLSDTFRVATRTDPLDRTLIPISRKRWQRRQEKARR